MARKAKKGVTLLELERLIQKHHGNLSRVAKELGVARYRVERKILQSLRLQRVMYEQRQIWADEIEGRLREATTRKKKPDLAVGLRVLESIAPDRGWGKTIRIEGNLGMVNIEVRKPGDVEALKKLAQRVDERKEELEKLADAKPPTPTAE